MGLDVNLIQFKNLDTEAIMEFARFAYEPDKPGQRLRMSARDKARELALPESIVDASDFGGTPISFPSRKHPNSMPVGEWYSFGTTREIMEHFTGLHLHLVFPEAVGNPPLVRPNWAVSRKWLATALQELQKVSAEQIKDYHDRFILPGIPPVFLAKVPASMQSSPSEIFEGNLAQIEVMIETLDHVLNHERPQEFLLRWSA